MNRCCTKFRLWIFDTTYVLLGGKDCVRLVGGQIMFSIVDDVDGNKKGHYPLSCQGLPERDGIVPMDLRSSWEP